MSAMESNIAKLVSELAKETVKESEAVGVSSLNELKRIHANTSKLVEAESSMKKLIAKTSDNCTKLDKLQTVIESLLLSTQNQTRLCAIETLSAQTDSSNTNKLFPDYASYRFSGHSEFCHILISILKTHNQNCGAYLSAYTPEIQEYIAECIHSLTGMKPRIANHTDGKPVIWRE